MAVNAVRDRRWRIVFASNAVCLVNTTRADAGVFASSSGHTALAHSAPRAVLALAVLLNDARGDEVRAIVPPGEKTRREATTGERERLARVCEEWAGFDGTAARGTAARGTAARGTAARGTAATLRDLATHFRALRDYVCCWEDETGEPGCSLPIGHEGTHRVDAGHV